MDFRKFATDNASAEFGARYSKPVPVHRITRWTAIAADETPWCGRRDNEAMVNRTQHGEYVTCADCLANTEVRRCGGMDSLRGLRISREGGRGRSSP